MRHTRHAADGNHWEILAALKKVTVVEDIHNGSLGADLVARHVFAYAPVFIEIKDPRQKPSARRLTAKEAKLMTDYPLNYAVVLTIDDALRAVGL